MDDVVAGDECHACPGMWAAARNDIACPARPPRHEVRNLPGIEQRAGANVTDWTGSSTARLALPLYPSAHEHEVPVQGQRSTNLHRLSKVFPHDSSGNATQLGHGGHEGCSILGLGRARAAVLIIYRSELPPPPSRPVPERLSVLLLNSLAQMERASPDRADYPEEPPPARLPLGLVCRSTASGSSGQG